jgi:rubrerythrin
MEDKQIKSTYKLWECKNCGYSISDIEYLNIKIDLGCPRCNESLLKFKSKTI